MKKGLVLTAALIIAIDANLAYAINIKKHDYPRNTSKINHTQPKSDDVQDIAGIVQEVSYESLYIVLGEARFNIDKAVYTTTSNKPISLSDIRKGNKVKLVINKGVVTSVLVY
ncbi:MAG: hypothetical protein HQL06_01680 [Nitrospirae bacterium]|nr:hypothetical protein [Nitrospirota bacterium]